MKTYREKKIDEFEAFCLETFCEENNDKGIIYMFNPEPDRSLFPLNNAGNGD